MIMSDVEHSYDWNFTHGQDSWELCYNNILEELPLKRVCDIVLHLRISGEPWTDATIADRKASAIKTFEPFEHLRLLAPKKAKVEIFVPTISSQFIDEQILDKEMACLKDTFVKRLLDPKITKADLVDALTKRITRLEWSKGKAQTFAERNENQAVECLMVAKRARAGVEANRAAIKDLKAALQRDDEEEMERLAMPEELDE